MKAILIDYLGIIIENWSIGMDFYRIYFFEVSSMNKKIINLTINTLPFAEEHGTQIVPLNTCIQLSFLSGHESSLGGSHSRQINVQMSQWNSHKIKRHF